MYIKITISLFSYFILMHYKLHYELKNASQKFQLLQFAIVNFKEREIETTHLLMHFEICLCECVWGVRGVLKQITHTYKHSIV